MKSKNAAFARRRGFTLLELLVVVSIMVILAGLTLGVMSYVNQKQAHESAKVQIGLLELALEEYFADNGKYPLNMNAQGTGGTSRIYRELFPDREDEKIYLAELDPESDTQGWLQKRGNTYQIIDPWGNEYRYRSNNPARPGNVIAANPGFDLWSVGPDGRTSAGNSGGYQPQAEQNLDDVRSW